MLLNWGKPSKVCHNRLIKTSGTLTLAVICLHICSSREKILHKNFKKSFPRNSYQEIKKI